MGCAQSIVDDKANIRSEEIENQLFQERLKAKNDVKILVLGPGQSGKSTLLKKMKLINHGYNEVERQAYKDIIFSNTVQSMRVTLEAMPYLELTIAPQNDLHRSLILSLPIQIGDDSLLPDIVNALRSLWKDPAVKAAVVRSREFQLNDSAVYNFNSIERLAVPSYLPTDEDILRSRVRSTGITQTTLVFKELTFKLFDVSGQRGERKKWLPCFENIPVLVFLASLSDYDQTLYEDESVNCLQETLRLFDSICNSRWFVKTGIVLLLNKIDLFAEKLPLSPLSDYFPDYTAGNDYDAACDYLLHCFLNLYQNATTRAIHAYFTCAINAQQIAIVFDVIYDSHLQFNLRECGLL